MVGVLILVHQHVPEFALIILQNVLVLLQKLNGDIDNIVKIQRVVVLQAGLVFPVGAGDVLRPDVAGALRPVQHLPGRHHFVLLPADGAKDIFRRKRLIVQLHVLDDLFHDALGVRGIVNGKAPGEAHPLDVPPQNTAAGGMKRHRPDVLRMGAEKIGKPFLHFICGLVGKGDGDDAPRRGRLHGAEGVRPAGIIEAGVVPQIFQKSHVVLRDGVGNFAAVAAPAEAHEVGNAVNEDGGLAAACTGKQQQRPLRGQHGLTLHIVQLRKLPLDVIFPGGQKSGVHLFCHNCTCLQHDAIILAHFRQNVKRENAAFVKGSSTPSAPEAWRRPFSQFSTPAPD